MKQFLNNHAWRVAHALLSQLQASSTSDLVIDNTDKTFMPIHLELRSARHGFKTIFSIAHYFNQEGDLMSDTYMEFDLMQNDLIMPIVFQQH